uniref:EF-hand domain-containing protein n=1 Tax=Panagrolaimus sp. PS1159 TaxID=55785 RepID=A0AC35EZH3_9BILA
MLQIFWIYFCFGFIISVLSSPSILPIIAYQKFTGESLPSCSISSYSNETVNERFYRLDRSRQYRLSFNDFLFADQCAIKYRRINFNKIDINYDGIIDKKEWDIWSRKFDADKRKEKLEENRKLFEFFDKDSNSKLDVPELRKYIRFLQFLRFERCAILRHKRKFRKMDFNGDGYISLNEFQKFYNERDNFWKNVYDMRMNSVVHKYDKDGDMNLNKNELKNYLSEQNLDDQNVDYFLHGKRHLTPKQFADWEETLPNSLFPKMKRK